MNITIIVLMSYVGFTVGPARVDKALFGAGEITEVLEVQNLSDDSLRIRLLFEDFDIDRTGKVTFFEPGTKPNSVASFATVNPEEFFVPPHGRQYVRMTFRAPAQSQIPEYNGMLIFRSQPIPTQYKPTVSVAGEIGVPIYYPVSQLITRDAVIDSLEIIRDSIYVVFRNASNIHLRVKGEATVLTLQDNVVTRDSIHEFVVLPDHSRRLVLPIEKPLGSGTYSVKVLFDYGALELIEGERMFRR